MYGWNCKLTVQIIGKCVVHSLNSQFKAWIEKIVWICGFWV